MRMLSCQEGRIYMKVPLPVYRLSMTPTCQPAHMVCACVWCVGLFMWFLKKRGGRTCTYVRHFWTHSNVYDGVYGSGLCVYVLCYFCASAAYRSSFIAPFQMSVYVCVCGERRQSQKKAWSHKDSTVCLMLLSWPCEVCEHTSFSEFSYSLLRKYGLNRTFRMMAFVK